VATTTSPKTANNAPSSGARTPPSTKFSAIPLDRVLPNSYEAERAVLGAILYRPDEAGPQVQELLTEESFYHAPHIIIFREMMALIDSMSVVDMVTLTQRLQDKNQLEAVGGPTYLADLLMSVPSITNLEHYIDVVTEKCMLRKLVTASVDIVGRCFEEQDDVKRWTDQVEQEIFKITAERSTSQTHAIKDLIKDAMRSIEQLYDKKGAITGLPTGYRDFDKLTSGLHEGEVVVIAARPSMGKTALALNIAEHIAVDHQIPVGIFSLEMSADGLVKRLLCSRAQVNLRSVRDGFLSEKDFPRLTAIASQLMRAPIYIDDSAHLTINQVRAKARRLKSQFDIRLLVIDYLQLVQAPSRRAEFNRQVEISDISAGIKALAKELKIPIVVLSQLNRQPEQREGGRPKLADLRESGAIEQDADVVGLLVRPEVYAEEEGEKASEHGKATLIIAKQRNGPTGDVHLTFRHEFTRFEDRAKIEEEDVPDREKGGE
jgi:replicative DNA helicase